MKEFMPIEECNKCGGACCQRMPAPYTPADIESIFGSLYEAIESGKVAIDAWDGDVPLYFLRPKIVGVAKLVDYSWGGTCMHWSDKGCALPREQMPTFCKTLEPKANGGSCDDHIKKENSKYFAALLWKRAKVDFTRWV